VDVMVIIMFENFCAFIQECWALKNSLVVRVVLISIELFCKSLFQWTLKQSTLCFVIAVLRMKKNP